MESLLSSEQIVKLYDLAFKNYEAKFMENHVFRVIQGTLSIIDKQQYIDRNFVEALALCHDLLEDTKVKSEDIKAITNSNYFDKCLKQLTKVDGKYPKTTCRESILVKLVDRACNLTSDYLVINSYKSISKYIDKASKIEW